MLKIWASESEEGQVEFKVNLHCLYVCVLVFNIEYESHWGAFDAGFGCVMFK